MDRARLGRIGLTVAVLLLVQGAAVGVYLGIEARRRSGERAPFHSERLHGTKGAPDMELTRPDGSLVRLSDLRGKTVLLHFWATWCPPCRRELPGLLELGRDLGAGDRFVLIAVTVDADWETVRAFFGGEIPSAVLRDASGSGYQRYDISILPDTYLLAPDGALTLRFGGAREWQSEGARELLRRELAATR